MSSKGYATPLRLDLGPNPLLQRLTLAMTFSAVVTLLLLPLPTMVNLLAVLLLLWFVRYVWYQRAELGGAPVKLVWDGEEQWWWRSGGVEIAVSLQDDVYLTPLLVALNFRANGRHRSVVLTPAAIGEETFRRILVRFRITPKGSSPA